jgi:hypothetical protein
MTGSITSLRPGGIGFIASDAFGRPYRFRLRRLVLPNSCSGSATASGSIRRPDEGTSTARPPYA